MDPLLVALSSAIATLVVGAATLAYTGRLQRSSTKEQNNRARVDAISDRLFERIEQGLRELATVVSETEQLVQTYSGTNGEIFDFVLSSLELRFVEIQSRVDDLRHLCGIAAEATEVSAFNSIIRNFLTDKPLIEIDDAFHHLTSRTKLLMAENDNESNLSDTKLSLISLIRDVLSPVENRLREAEREFHLAAVDFVGGKNE